MNEDSDVHDVTEAVQTKDDNILVLDSARVKSGGRITIPAEMRERRGIEEGDWVDAILILED